MRARDPETGKNVVVLTNDFTLPALTVAEFYRARWQILSVHLFEKAPLAQVLAGPDYTLDDTHVRNQLRLFDF